MSIAEKFEVIADEVYEKGKEYIWEVVQQGGTRTDYSYGFCHWHMDGYLHPKYKVVPTDDDSGNQTFCKMKGVSKIESKYFDFSQKTRGTSASRGWYYTFSTCDVEEIEDIGMQADYTHSYTFAWSDKLHTIAVIRTDENTTWSGAFESCSNLQNITIEGKIGKKGFNVRWSKKLTKASLLSILKALSLNITETTTITFSTEHQSIIETDTDCQPYWEAAKNAGWSFVYA